MLHLRRRSTHVILARVNERSDHEESSSRRSSHGSGVGGSPSKGRRRRSHFVSRRTPRTVPFVLALVVMGIGWVYICYFGGNVASRNPYRTRRNRSPSFEWPPVLRFEDGDLESDYGDLDFEDLPSDSFRRQIREDDVDDYELERYDFLTEIDEFHVSMSNTPIDELPYPLKCEPVEWKAALFPVCNTIHELTRSHQTDKYLGQVYFMNSKNLVTGFLEIEYGCAHLCESTCFALLAGMATTAMPG